MPQLQIQDFPLWENLKTSRRPLAFDIEITARCNNDCRHCYINLPVNDAQARSSELTCGEIIDITAQAAGLGAMWCLITGGEPLLREDFADIYMGIKRQGLITSIFTNATAIRSEHVALFKKYPPRDIEVTVYGASRESYERVTRRPGSFASFKRGLDRLLDAGLKVRLKAMALRSNLNDMEAIAAFGRTRTKDFYRFDPQLHLRYDGNASRNEEIQAERLPPAEVVELERADPKRFGAMEAQKDVLINNEFTHLGCDHLFHCGAGKNSFVVGYDGTFRLCASLWAPGTMVNLRELSLREAWETFVPQVRDLRSHNTEYLDSCLKCSIVNLCLHCAAHAYLETGAMDGPTPYFCEVAHQRAAALKK
ncbi:MAG: radical SAM protein [Anaerolineales bacterium]